MYHSNSGIQCFATVELPGNFRAKFIGFLLKRELIDAAFIHSHTRECLYR